MHSMTKDTFKLVTEDETGLCYITKAIDEETKNHKESDSEIISGYMPELPNNKYCPVQSFLTYKISLDPKIDHLWQKPKMKVFPADGKGTWYGPQRMGHNPLDGFITNLSDLCGIKEKGYTNHSLRATAITALTRHHFSSKQIMSVTGHKSISSLAIYQKVNGNEKLKMGFALGLSLVNPNVPAIQQSMAHENVPVQPMQKAIEPPNPMPAIAAITNVVNQKENVTENNALIPFTYETEDPLQDAAVPSFDLAQILNDVQNETELIAVSQTATKCHGNDIEMAKQQIVKKTSPKVPIMFSGCTINGNVTINMPK